MHEIKKKENQRTTRHRTGQAYRSLLVWAVLMFLIIFSQNASLLTPNNVYALDVPPLLGYVNDYANIMSPSTRAMLETELKAFEQSDSTQMVILTIPSLQGEVLEEFSIKVAEKWKIGQQGKDNGLILLVANQERKIRIEVGRGLEGKLTDLMAGRIIDFVIKPSFKRGDYNGGFVAGMHALIDATRGEFKAEPRPLKRKRSPLPLFTFIIFGWIFWIFLGKISRGLGAAAGAIGLPAMAYHFLTPPIFLLIILGVVGLFFGWMMPMLFTGGGRSFSSPKRAHRRYLGGLGSYGGGWSGGGSDSGGGFSGGGGDFGGGGASGDW
jgi:uncharacterized protein